MTEKNTTCLHCGYVFSAESTSSPGHLGCPACGARSDNEKDAWPQPDRREPRPATKERSRYELVECPWCSEEIPADARKCPECGSSTDAERNPEGHGIVEVGEVFSETWELFQQHWGLLVGATLLNGLLNAGAQIPETVCRVLAERNHEPGLVFVGLFFGLLRAGFQFWLSLGLTQMLLNIVQTGHAELSDLFSGNRCLGTGILNAIVFFLGLIVALLLLIFPAFFYILMFWPFLMVVVDRPDLSGLEPSGEARRITQGNWGSTIVLWLAAFLINVLGLLAFCVGLFVTGPYVSLMFTVAYQHMCGGRTAASRRYRSARDDEEDEDESSEDDIDEYSRS